MGVRYHEDLEAWRLAHELHREIVRLTGSKRTSKDRRFCDQVRSSSDSAMANIAEGFGRYKPRDFARFARIARGSLGETQSHLRGAADRDYITETECRRLCRLASRALDACTSLIMYLQTASEPDASP